jgi:hypothetical protein
LGDLLTFANNNITDWKTSYVIFPTRRQIQKPQSVTATNLYENPCADSLMERLLQRICNFRQIVLYPYPRARQLSVLHQRMMEQTLQTFEHPIARLL